MINRRELLKRMGVGALLGPLLPKMLKAEPAAPKPAPITGTHANMLWERANEKLRYHSERGYGLTTVLRGGFVQLKGVDISDGVVQAQITQLRDSNGRTEGWEAHLHVYPGFADAVLFPLLGTVVPFVLRPSPAPCSVNNPEFHGTALLRGYNSTYPSTTTIVLAGDTEMLRVVR